MNPLSAFSFGQLIKTFLPGLIASVSPFLVLETLYEWKKISAPASLLEFLQGSLAAKLIGANLVGWITLWVLLALLLGFSLNSVHWALFHDICRKRCISPELEKANQELRRVAKRALEEVLPGRYGRPQPSIQGFFLSQVDLAKHTFLRESYFAWYEFHMNSLVALGVVLITFVVTSISLTAHWGLAWESEAALILLVTVVCAGAMFFLWRAALLNLQTYEERSFWFLIGTLHSLQTDEAQPARPGVSLSSLY